MTQRTIITKIILDSEALRQIKKLEEICIEVDNVTLKLELEYKASVAGEEGNDNNSINEFLCYDNDQIIGYAGICGFDGVTLEVNGMIHPDYRRQGIFSELMKRVIESFDERKEQTLLLLCDSDSISGQHFMQGMDATYSFSEYEMYLDTQATLDTSLPQGIIFYKATNDNAKKIAQMNAVVFDKPLNETDMPLPETEEQRGMTMYLASVDDEIVGKVNVQRNSDAVGIYGLGVMPEYRGKGYGRELLKFAIKKAQELNVSDVMLQVEAENEKALNLYTKCGFEVTSKMDYYRHKNSKV